MLVAEWDNVAEYGSSADRVSSSSCLLQGGNFFAIHFQTNSYQGIVITDGTESYALFIYQCGAVSWHGNATVGFNAGGTWFENHPFSGTRNVASVSCLNTTTSVWTNLVYKLTPDGKSTISIET